MEIMNTIRSQRRLLGSFLLVLGSLLAILFFAPSSSRADSTHPPANPTNFTATPSTGGTPYVDLSWTNPADADFDGVYIYRSTTKGVLGSRINGGSLITGATTFQDTGVSLSTQYYYTIQSVDTYANESSNVDIGGPYETDANTKLLWHMNESSGSTVSDSSGNNSNGSSTSTVTTGKFGNGRYTQQDMGGFASQIYTTALSGKDSAWADGSVEFWFNPDSNPQSTTHYLFYSESFMPAGDCSLSLSVLITSGSLRAGHCSSYASYVIPTNWAGTWVHIAVSWDGDKTRLYVDGSLVSTTDVTGGTGTYDDAYYFGSSQCLGYDCEMSGNAAKYDELRISNVARSAFSSPVQVSAVPFNGSAAITSPNGGSAYKGGGTQNITWTTSGSGIDSITLLYSVDDGATYNEIADGEANDGTYAWTLPKENSEDVRVKVQLIDSGGVVLKEDASDTVFEIDSTSPGLPDSINVTPTSNGPPGTTLSWVNPNDIDLAGINIYRSETEGDKGSLIEAIANTATESYEDSGLTAGVTYYYMVVAYDHVGNESKHGLALDGSTIGLWKFNEGTGTTTSDLSVNANTATLNNTPTWTTGKFDGALEFVGSSTEYLTASLPTTATTNTTLEAWVRLDSTSAKGTFVKVGGSYGYGFGVGSGTTDISGNELVGIFENIKWVPTGVNIGTGWHHVAMVLNGSGVPLFYLDGALVYTGTAGPGTPNTGMGIGGNYDGARPFTGAIDDVRISNVARDLSEMQDSAEGDGIYQVSATPLDPAPGLVTSISATPGFSGVLNLSWVNPADPDIVGVNIYRSSLEGTLGTKVNDTPVAGTTYEDSSLDNGTTYYYVIKAVDEMGQEAKGDSKTWTSQDDWSDWTLSQVADDTVPGSLQLSKIESNANQAPSATASGTVDTEMGSPVSAINDNNTSTGAMAAGSVANPYILTWASPVAINKVRLYNNGMCWYGWPSNVTFSYWDGSTWITPSAWNNKATGAFDCFSTGWTSYYTLPDYVFTTKVKVSASAGFDLAEFDATGGLTYETPGTATIQFNPYAAQNEVKYLTASGATEDAEITVPATSAGAGGTVAVSGGDSAADVKSALEVLTGISTVTVTGSTTAPGTADVTGSGTAGGTYMPGGSEPWEAFDDDPDTYWSNDMPPGMTPNYLSYDFGSGQDKTATYYSIQSSVANYRPKAWTFEGSADNSSWTTLDTQSGITWTGNYQVQEFSFSNATAYRYYRINITDTEGGGESYPALISEMQIGETPTSSGRYEITISNPGNENIDDWSVSGNGWSVSTKQQGQADDSRILVWNVEKNASIPTGASIDEEYSADGVSWVNSMSSLSASDTLHVRFTLENTDSGKTPQIDNATIYYFTQTAGVPEAGNSVPTVSNLGPSTLVDGSSGTDTTPALTFTTADVDGGDTVKYQIQIDDSADFSSPLVDYTSALTTQGSKSFTVGQAAGTGSYASGSEGQTLPVASYYWRVRVTDSDDATSSYVVARSGSVAFQVIDGSAIPSVRLKGGNINLKGGVRLK